MTVLLALIITAGLLVGNELWSRRHHSNSELSRKFIHITVGSVVAFWPFWLTWTQIELLSVAFLIVVAFSKRLQLFKAIHSVRRPTQGEFFFALSVGSVALITHDKWIYATALLQMSLADGLAAVIGVRYGKGQQYSMFGHQKSLAGSATFLVTSLLIFVGYASVSDVNIGVSAIVGMSLLATAIENLAVLGLDNLLVPVAMALILRALV